MEPFDHDETAHLPGKLDAVASAKKHRTREIFGHHVRKRGVRLHYVLLEDLEVSLRYGCALAVVLAIILFSPTDVIIDEFPAFFLMGITATLIFLIPYTGSAIERTLSWSFGALVAVLLSYIVTLILGTETRDVELMVPTGVFTCLNSTGIATQSLAPIVGEEGVRSDEAMAIPLGFIIFFTVFLLSYFSSTAMWRSAAIVLFTTNVLTYYVGMVEPLAEPVGAIYFLKVARTTILGCAISAVVLLIPFPRFIAKPRLLPRPRGALPQVLADVDESGDLLARVLHNLVAGYVLGGRFELIESLLRLTTDLERAQANICRSMGLIHISGRWEPLPSVPGLPFLSCFTPWRVRVGTLQAVLREMNLLNFQLKYLVNTFRMQPLALKEGGYQWEGVDHEIFKSVQRLGNMTVEVLRQTLTWKGSEAPMDALRAASDALEEQMSRKFEDIALHSLDFESSATAREIAFHCSCIWKIHDACKTVGRIHCILWQTSPSKVGPLFPMRVLGWPLEYLAMWKDMVMGFVALLRGQVSWRKYTGLRHRTFSGSLQLALAATIASLFVLINELRRNIPSTLAIVPTALLIMDRDDPGSQFTKSENRLTGTALAIGASFLITVIWPEGDDLGTFFFVLGYGLLARFVQTNPRYANTTFSFMVTLFAILFERFPTVIRENINLTISGRATATVFGVVIASLSNVMWPIRARNLIWHSVSSNLRHRFIPLTHDVLNVFLLDEVLERHTAGLIAAITAEIKTQRAFCKEADVEPQLWREPFPTAACQLVIEREEKLLNSLVPCQRMAMALRQRLRDSGDLEGLCDVLSPEPWAMLEGQMVQKLAAIAVAVNLGTEVSEAMAFFSMQAHAKAGEDSALLDCDAVCASAEVPMVEQHMHFIENVRGDVRAAAEKGTLPPCAQVALWALLWNMRVVAVDIVKLRSAVDAVYDRRHATKRQGLTLCHVYY